MSFGADDNGFRFRAATILGRGARQDARHPHGGLRADAARPRPGERRWPTSASTTSAPCVKKTIDGFSGQSPQIAQALTASEAMTGASSTARSCRCCPASTPCTSRRATRRPIPSVGLLLKPEDAAAGAATIKKLTATLCQGASASGRCGLQIEDIPNGQRFSGPRAQSPPSCGVRPATSSPSRTTRPPATSRRRAWPTATSGRRSRSGGRRAATCPALLYVDIAGAIRFARGRREAQPDPQAANTQPLRRRRLWRHQGRRHATADVFVQVAK